MERKHWVDLIKGVSMLVVLIAHTDIYYTGNMLGEYYLSLMNALFVFFAMSGYLMYKEGQAIDLCHKLKGIAKGIIFPYFIFMTAIYVPKHLAHGDGISVMQMLTDIAWRGESWFVTALVVAEVIFSLVVWASRGRTVWIVLCAVTGLCLSALLPDAWLSRLPWHADNGLQALLFLGAGFLYHKYERQLSLLQRPLAFTLLTLAVILVKWTEVEVEEIDLVIYPIIVTSYPAFVTDFVVSTLWVVVLFKQLPRCRALEWIGQHSLVYYFICGGVPLTVSRLASAIGMTFESNALFLAPVIIAVCAVSTVIVYLIYRYVPFVTGKFKDGSKNSDFNILIF